MTRERKLLVILLFNTVLMAAEIAGGLVSHSLALLSDAGHMLTDSLAIFLSFLAIHWSKKPATGKRTFGYHRTEVLAAFINGITLLTVSCYIFYEAAHRFFVPVMIRTDIMLVIAVIGLIGNLVGVYLLHDEHHDSMNVRGAFLHLLGDALSSVGVIIGGIVVAYTGWGMVDSLVSILIGGIVLRGAVGLILESTDVLLESAPDDIDVNTLRAAVQLLPGVRDLHDIHVWTITSGKRALSGHLLVDDIATSESQKILCAVRAVLASDFNITHSTIETECEACGDNACSFTVEHKEHGETHQHEHH